MSWCRYEPTLEDILSDPIVGSVMKADGVDPQELAAMLAHIADVRAAAQRPQPPPSAAIPAG